VARGAIGAGWTRIDARVCRLLQEPGRVKLFFQLLALGIIRPVSPPGRVDALVWMILPPGNNDPNGPRVVWLTRPTEPGEDPTPALSLLFAIERFCLTEKSDKPGGEIPIDYRALDLALNAGQAALIADGSYNNLISKYQDFLDKELHGFIDRFVQFSDDEGAPKTDEEGPVEDLKQEDAVSLNLVAKYYLDEVIRQLRVTQNAQNKYRIDAPASGGV
jgi:hypothetical protein